jgi:protein tyrosine phosphatase (PTP) superfamily phosphohydrolase (DUF442 family)
MPQDPDDIPCWQRLNDRTTTSGRIAPGDIKRLSDIGVCHVINLALADSPGGLVDEARLIAEQGLRYTHIPVPFDAPDEAQFQAFCAAYVAEPEPVHIHCILNWRVSAFFYRYHRANGMAEGDARAIMEQQWQPQTSDHPAWAQFIAKEDQ